jgi:hypothetical protein
MTKEFVPFELAVKLKQIGFDEPCLGFYSEFSNNKVAYGLADGFNKAPTFSQAFRWFREKYQIDSWIYPNLNGLYSVSIVRKCVGIGRITEYPIYEEAELACLDRLIEILTKQQEQ